MITAVYPYETWARANLEVVKEGQVEWNVRCPSPAHDDDSPSAYFNVAKGVGYCQACSYKWGAGEITDINLKIKMARDRINKMQTPDPGFIPAPEDTLDRYDITHNYWNDRKISAEIQDLFQLGYDTQANAVTIPMRSMRGGLIGVTRRFLADDHEGSRYKYPFGFRAAKNVFASWLHEDYDMSTLVITEGAIDTMRWWCIGQPAGAIYGSSPSEFHVQTMYKMGVRKVIYVGDSDEAGIRAKQRAKGWWPQVDGSYRYQPETDMSRLFAMYHIPYHDRSVNPDWFKDSGDMSNDQLEKCLNDVEIYHFEPPKAERRHKFYVPKSKLRALKRSIRKV